MGTLGLLAAKCDFSSGTKSHRAAPVTFGELGWGASGKGTLKTRGGARPASLSSFCMDIRTYEYGLRNDLIVSRHMVVDEIDHCQHLPGSAAGLKKCRQEEMAAAHSKTALPPHPQHSYLVRFNAFLLFHFLLDSYFMSHSGLHLVIRIHCPFY